MKSSWTLYTNINKAHKIYIIQKLQKALFGK